jgi:hypothetical protein
MKSDWKGFERLAERIARDLAPHATITWDDHLPGGTSETDRQIDVSIRWTDAGREHLTIVQAKDWGTPADVKAIDAFASVIKDVDATRGVMVCRSGFTKKAKAYARNLGIGLYNLHDAESRNWRLELTIPLLWIDLHPSAEFPCRIHLDKGEQLAIQDGFPILYVPGGPRIHPATVFEQLWNQRAIPDTPGSGTPSSRRRCSRPSCASTARRNGETSTSRSCTRSTGGPGWASSPPTSAEAWSTTSTTTPSPPPTCRSGRSPPNATTSGSRSTTRMASPSASAGRW